MGNTTIHGIGRTVIYGTSSRTQTLVLFAGLILDRAVHFCAGIHVLQRKASHFLPSGGRLCCKEGECRRLSAPANCAELVWFKGRLSASFPFRSMKVVVGVTVKPLLQDFSSRQVVGSGSSRRLPWWRNLPTRPLQLRKSAHAESSIDPHQLVSCNIRMIL